MSNLPASVILVVAGFLSLLACALVSYMGRRRVVKGTTQESLLSGLTLGLFFAFIGFVIVALYSGFGFRH